MYSLCFSKILVLFFTMTSGLITVEFLVLICIYSKFPHDYVFTEDTSPALAVTVPKLWSYRAKQHYNWGGIPLPPSTPHRYPQPCSCIRTPAAAGGVHGDPSFWQEENNLLIQWSLKAIFLLLRRYTMYASFPGLSTISLGSVKAPGVCFSTVIREQRKSPLKLKIW